MFYSNPKFNYEKEIIFLFLFSTGILFLLFSNQIYLMLIFLFLNLALIKFCLNKKKIVLVLTIVILLILWALFYRINHWENFSIKNLIDKIPKEINLRKILIDYINSSSSKKVSNLINLIVLNYRDKNISKFYYGLINLGVAHLFVVSGLHISFLNLIIKKIFKFNLFLSNIINVIFSSFYCFLLGMSFGVVRVFLNNLLVFLRLKNFENKGLVRVCYCGIIVYIINPFAVFDLGFQLSFIGVFTICFTNYFKWMNKFGTTLLISFFINILIAPITLQINLKINILTIFNSWILSPIMLCYYLFSLLIFPLPFIYEFFEWFYYLLYKLMFILQQIKVYWYFKDLPSSWLFFLNYLFYYLFIIIFIKIRDQSSRGIRKFDDSYSFRRPRINYSRITKDSW